MNVAILLLVVGSFVVANAAPRRGKRFIDFVKEPFGSTGCDMSCPEILAIPQICGSDGKMYANNCLFEIAACENPDLVPLDEAGPCLMGEVGEEDGCEKPCTRESMLWPGICGSDGENYMNHCLFEIAQCKNPDLERILCPTVEQDGCVKPCPRIQMMPGICGSDGKTYGNNCEFEIAQCKNPDLTEEHKSYCD